MDAFHYSSLECYRILDEFHSTDPSFPKQCVNLTSENYRSLSYLCGKVYDSEDEGKYSKPMVWVGVYIAIASLFCILAMVADLLRGFQNRKFWIPCKYFSLNAASITVITVAMKLPVDLSSPMQGYVDQTAKLGSMAFMCTMMANIMPSLVSMDNKVLLANVIGFTILVMTIIVNITIEINTGVIYPYFAIAAYIYIVMILFLLLIMTSSAITIPRCKIILESKYQATGKRALNDQHPQHTIMSLEKLRQHVERYWVMEKTSNPQFVIASSPTCSSSGVICVLGLLMYILVGLPFLMRRDGSACESEYKWSMLAILITQFIGVVVGTIAPILRCFTVLSFKLSTKWHRNHWMVFKVEKYWTDKLCEWKESRIPFFSSGRRSRILVHNFKNLVLSLCIGFQKVTVVSCKMIGLVPIFVLIVVIYCSYCWKSLKTMLFSTPIASRSNYINEDLRSYFLQLEDKMELAEKTLKNISNSLNRLIQKSEKEQHKNLLKLLEKSTGFNGVEYFDIDQVQPLLSVEFCNIWSLPIVTLTCIAVALPNIRNDIVDTLFRGVGEGLFYTHIVEKSLNNANEYVNIQRATMTLWHEVEDNGKWLEYTLEKDAYKGKTSIEILKWFAEKAEEIVVEINKSTNGELAENTPNKLIVANSMYRIARTLLLNYQSNIDMISEVHLFAMLSGMIADILAGCLTNIPQVISMKCHESAIEKREASVEAAAELLGRSLEIIKRLEAHEPTSLDLDQMAFIDEWRVHLKQSIP